MIVGLTVDQLHKQKNRVKNKRKANTKGLSFQDIISTQEVTHLEIRNVANTKYDEMYNAKIQQDRSLCHVYEKEGYEMIVHPVILGVQGSVFNCFKAAMTAFGVQGRNK